MSSLLSVSTIRCSLKCTISFVLSTRDNTNRDFSVISLSKPSDNRIMSFLILLKSLPGLLRSIPSISASSTCSRETSRKNSISSIRNINAMYYPLCQLYLRPVARVSNGYFSGISEVVVIKIDAI